MTPDQARRLIRCYPQAWRERYGDELAVLLEQQPWTLRIVADVLYSALKMHGQHVQTIAVLILRKETALWLWWLLASMAGWVSAVGMLYWSSLRYEVSSPAIPTAVMIGRLVAGGLAGGATLGTLQWLVLRRRMARAWPWIPATTTGWLAGNVLAATTLVLSGPLHALPWPASHIVRGLFFGCTAGVVVGALQRRSVRARLELGTWWIPTTSLSWGCGWVLGTFWSDVMLGGSGLTPGFDVAGVIVGPAVGGAVYGLVSGLVLAGLLATHEPRSVTTRQLLTGGVAAASAFVLLGLMLAPAMIRDRGPTFTIQEMTQWPEQPPYAMTTQTAVPSPTVTMTWGGTPRPSFSDPMDLPWENTTIAEAQTRLPFHVLVPRVLPPGYVLVKVIVPRQLINLAEYRDRSAFVHLVYANLALQRPGYDWHRQVGALPDQALVIAEAPASRQPRVIAAYPGTAQRLTLAGHPAVVLSVASVKHSGSRAVIADANQVALLTMQAGMWVDVHGWRAAGVDQARLQQVVVSLH